MRYRIRSGFPYRSNVVRTFRAVQHLGNSSFHLLWHHFFINFSTQASALASSPIGAVFTPFNQTFFQPNIELISAQYPNPFKGVASQSFIDTNEDLLSLVDGGHDGENIPIQPLLVKARGVDTIFVIDVVCP